MNRSLKTKSFTLRTSLSPANKRRRGRNILFTVQQQPSLWLFSLIVAACTSFCLQPSSSRTNGSYLNLHVAASPLSTFLPSSLNNYHHGGVTAASSASIRDCRLSLLRVEGSIELMNLHRRLPPSICFANSFIKSIQPRSLSRKSNSYHPNHYCRPVSALLDVMSTEKKVVGTSLSSVSRPSTRLCSSSPSSSLPTNLGDDNSSESKINTVNILALHGKYDSGETFQTSLAPLEQLLSSSHFSSEFQFDYLTAPFKLPNDNGYAWWNLPPNTRSFTATEYIGFNETFDLIRTVLSEKQYDVVIGHSQGAILLAALMAVYPSLFVLPRDNLAEERSEKSQPQRQPPRGYILNGVAWPNPFGDRLEQFSINKHSSSETPSETGSGDNDNDSTGGTPSASTTTLPKLLFIIGENDDINPPEDAKRVRDCFIRGGLQNVSTCVHAGKHSIPTNERAMKQIVDWIIDVVGKCDKS